MIASKAWWKAAGIRALKTFAQTVVGTAVVIGTISANTDWQSVGWTVASVFISAFVAAVLSMFTSIAGLPEVEE